jgi:hypothetical protein
LATFQIIEDSDLAFASAGAAADAGFVFPQLIAPSCWGMSSEFLFLAFIEWLF